MATYWGTVSEFPELPWEALPLTYNAHCHLDKMLKVFKKKSWNGLLEFQLSGVIASFVFPN